MRLSELCFSERIFCFINDLSVFLFQIVWFSFAINRRNTDIYRYLNYKIIIYYDQFVVSIFMDFIVQNFALLV